MIPKIAIQGHPTRGKEVIKILKILGGKNTNKLNGNGKDCIHFYHIDSCSVIRFSSKYDLYNYKFYTLEEFEKEFPFKIGDKVIITGLPDFPKIITKIACNYDEILYSFEDSNNTWFYADALKKFEMKEERNITLTLNKAKEWYNKGGELREVALQAYSEEELTKIELPKTWEEFCDNYPVKETEGIIAYDARIINCKGIVGKRDYNFKDICPSKKSAESHLALIQLEQLRDCYRQGDIPDFTKTGYKYCVAKINKQITVIESTYTSYFLSFTKKEVAEKFLTNFKPLIKIAEDYI